MQLTLIITSIHIWQRSINRIKAKESNTKRIPQRLKAGTWASLWFAMMPLALYKPTIYRQSHIISNCLSKIYNLDFLHFNIQPY
ncbi:MAG: hypothetical protein [Circoviridae sp.]|nr:MAG: hypothetical protein [Circoviridae sp.]